MAVKIIKYAVSTMLLRITDLQGSYSVAELKHDQASKHRGKVMGIGEFPE